jgi:hypothetical protein
MRNRLFVLSRFAHDPQGILTTIHRFALVGIELPLDSRLRIPAVGIAGELCVAPFADSECRDVSGSLYDPKIALGHIQSLAHREGWA